LYITISFEECVDSVAPHEEDVGQIFILLNSDIHEEGMTQMLTAANECPYIRSCSTWRTVVIFCKSCVTFMTCRAQLKVAVSTNVHFQYIYIWHVQKDTELFK